MMTRPANRTLAAGALLLGCIACGDVTSDLITESTGGSSGATPGGAGGIGGAGAGGSSIGGSAGAGSSAGGAGAGTGGTPECTTHEDCTDFERNLCDVTRGRCVECTSEVEGPCDIDENCNPVVGECGRPCASSADCIEPDDPVCAVNGFCVECQDNDDCPSDGQCANWQCSD